MDTYIETRPVIRFIDASFNYEMNENCTSADISFDFKIPDDVLFRSDSDISADINVVVNLFAPDGNLVLTVPDKESRQLNSPELWWCNGYGEPNLYIWEATMFYKGNITDTVTGKTGFRKVELTMGESTWDVPNTYPMSRSPAPATITLNGTAVFAKGSNWVNPEIFTGTITRDTYLPLIELAVEANFNLLRCWGGAIINKSSFFELCDEFGIMVWQDFPLACNDYRGTLHYLKILEQEASAIIKRLRHHPCLVMWCGGNELLNSWSKMTDQSLALRLLNKLCYELDRERPFITSAPQCGMAHGNYVFRYSDGLEVYQAMTEAGVTAYTEFGVPSFSNLPCIKLFTEESEIFPVKPDDVTIAHHAFLAYDGDSSRWACLDTIRHYFGNESSLNDLIVWSQWLQGEGYKHIYEESRRQKPFCSMALNWCYNEPWPALANNSIINYPAEPKASFKDITAACRPFLISARIPKFMWHKGESLSIELWLLNDSLSLVPAGVAEVSVEIDENIIGSGKWAYDEGPANTNIQGPVMEFCIPDIEVEGAKELTLRIDAGELSSVYRLLYRKHNK
jgi:beta-mannosidase